MSLGAVTKGRIERPIRVVIFGVPGLGKSTFASHAPSPIFVPTEDGTSELDVARFPRASSYLDAIEALDVLAKESHAYKTAVVDTLDALEPLVWAHVCATKPPKGGGRATSIEDYGYGAGFTLALEPWAEIFRRLDVLVAKGMNVILIAHHHVKEFKNPEGDNFERYSMKLHKTAVPLVNEWADAVLFANHETVTHKADAKAKAKGIGTGARVIHTQYSAAFDAKNRFSLPPSLPLSWAAFVEAIADGRVLPINVINQDIDEEMRGLDGALVERINAARKEAGTDPVKLANVLNRVKATKAAKEAA